VNLTSHCDVTNSAHPIIISVSLSPRVPTVPLSTPKEDCSFYSIVSFSIRSTFCLWKEIVSQQRIRHFKILQSIYFAYEVGVISSYSNRIFSCCSVLNNGQTTFHLFAKVSLVTGKKSCHANRVSGSTPRWLKLASNFLVLTNCGMPLLIFLNKLYA